MTTTTPATASAARRSSEGVLLSCMLALTFSTGIADAVGYLGLDRVFTGNMTGNVVILGMGLTGTAGLPVVGPLVALAAFLVGAAGGGRALRGQESGWSPRIPVLLAVVAAAFGGCAVFLGVADVQAPGLASRVVTAVVAAAMGVQAALARWVGVKDVTTVVVTSTLAGLAAESRLGGGSGQAWGRRAGSVLLIGAGAALGALLLEVGLWAGMAASCAITVAVLVRGEWHVRRG